MKRFLLWTMLMLASTGGMAFAQVEADRSGVAVTTTPIQIDRTDYDYLGSYVPPLWLSRFEVPEGQLPQFNLELTPQLHYMEHCVYNHAFHVWRFQGRVTAILSNAATGKVLSSQTFEGDIPPECPSKVTVTQLGDRITWPSDETLIAWLEATIGSTGEQPLMPFTAAQVTQLERVGDMVGAERSLEVLTFSPDSHYLAAGGEVFDPKVYLWDTANGNLVSTFLLSEEKAVEVRSVAFSADGKLLAAASAPGARGHFLRVWEVASKQLILETRELYYPSGGLAFNPDASLIALAKTASEIVLIDLASGEIVLTLAADYVHTLAFDLSGRRLFSVGMCAEQTCVQTWDVVSGKNLARLDLAGAFWRAVFSPDRERLAVSGESEHKGRVEVWQIAEAQLYAALPDQNGSVTSLAFNPEGTYLAVTASNDIADELTIWTLPALENKKTFLLTGSTASGRFFLSSPMSISPNFELVVTSKWYSDLVLWRAAATAAP